MMKNIVFMLISLSFSSCLLKKEKKVLEGMAMVESHADIEMVVFHHVDFDILSIVDVSCEEFESVFANSMEKDTIIDPNEISLIKKYMKNLKRIDSLSIKTSMDTRGKLYFISPLDTTEYCINNSVAYSNGAYYEISNDLLEYIESKHNR